jgi:two-component system sensor histidine kinase KdpD
LLQAFAAQAALAIGRSQLAEEEERTRQVANSERMKSIFLASVSHDLRTPLTTIRTAAAGLRQALGERFASPFAELTDSIDVEVDRLNRLVENLLEMSRIEAGGLPPKKAPEDLAEIIGTVAHRLRSLLADRAFTMHLPEDLPAIPLDAIQIDRVLSNLFENAVKFSPVNSAIQLDVWLAEQRVYVRMRNEGATLSEPERGHIFDKFYRREVSMDSARGTGLGLAICKGIVEAHAGRIAAENDPGGVAFTFWLPVETARTERPPVPVGVLR